MLLGYVRVSSVDQNEERQVLTLIEKGIEKENIFIDKKSGKDTDREAFKNMLNFCRKGDTVITESISRIARNTKDFLNTMDYLEQKNCGEVQARLLVEECMAEYEIDQNASLEMVECFKFETIAVFNRIMQQKECWTKEWKEKVMELVDCSMLCEFKEQMISLLVDFARKQQSRMEEECICARTKEYIDAHYNDSQLSVTVLGSMLKISPYYLSTLFRDKYQLTIPDYIAKTRINHAKILLRNSSDNILKIAKAAGFQESTSFIRVFKKLEGITPGAYRNFWLDKTTK